MTKSSSYLTGQFQTLISESSIVEFDFQSMARGGMNGIVIENEQFPSASKTFKLFGTRTFGLRTFNNYVPAMGKVR